MCVKWTGEMTQQTQKCSYQLGKKLDMREQCLHCVQCILDTILIFIWIFNSECIYNFKSRNEHFQFIYFYVCVWQCTLLFKLSQEKQVNDFGNSGYDLHMILKVRTQTKNIILLFLTLKPSPCHPGLCGCTQGHPEMTAASGISHTLVSSPMLLLGINVCKSLSGTVLKGKARPSHTVLKNLYR